MGDHSEKEEAIAGHLLFEADDPVRGRRLSAWGRRDRNASRPGSRWRVPGYVGGEPQQPVPRDVVGAMTRIGDRLPEDAAPLWSVDFWVPDVDAAAARAVEIGGAVAAPPSDSPVARAAVLADPVGATLSVSKVNGWLASKERPLAHLKRWQRCADSWNER